MRACGNDEKLVTWQQGGRGQATGVRCTLEPGWRGRAGQGKATAPENGVSAGLRGRWGRISGVSSGHRGFRGTGKPEGLSSHSLPRAETTSRLSVWLLQGRLQGAPGRGASSQASPGSPLWASVSAPWSEALVSVPHPQAATSQGRFTAETTVGQASLHPQPRPSPLRRGPSSWWSGRAK